jgi:hypothetical protein
MTACLEFDKGHLKDSQTMKNKMGIGRLVKIKEKMNGEKYSKKLDENVFHSTQDLRLGQRFTFQ